MRVTQFFVHGSGADATAPGAPTPAGHDGAPVRAEVAAQPDWQPFTEYDGSPLRGVELVELGRSGPAELQLVRIAAGGHFVMHASPDTAFCQVVEGAGTLRLPDGTTLAYTGPELYVFHPHTLHEWIDVTADTLLSVCLVATAGPGAGS